MSGRGRPAPEDAPPGETYYNGTERRVEVEGEEGRKRGSKVPPAKRKAKRRRKR